MKNLLLAGGYEVQKTAGLSLLSENSKCGSIPGPYGSAYGTGRIVSCFLNTTKENNSCPSNFIAIQELIRIMAQLQGCLLSRILYRTGSIAVRACCSA
jgi:hypothetical protein